MTQMPTADNFTTLEYLTRIRLIQAVTVCQGDIVERIWFFLLWGGLRPAQWSSDPQGSDCAGEYRFFHFCVTSRDPSQWRIARVAQHGQRGGCQFFSCGVAGGLGMSLFGKARITLGGLGSCHEDGLLGVLVGNGVVRTGYGFRSMPLAPG